MLVKELMDILSLFPAEYDVQIPVVPEGYMSPYLLIVDGGGKRQIWVTAMHHAGENCIYSEIKLDERGNFVRDDHFDEERCSPGACNGEFNE